jgi:hypothetical protein
MMGRNNTGRLIGERRWCPFSRGLHDPERVSGSEESILPVGGAWRGKIALSKRRFDLRKVLDYRPYGPVIGHPLLTFHSRVCYN